MSKIDGLRAQLIEWNNKFPLDREHRKKHNIVFGSEAHRAINQIDLYFDWLEDELFKDFLEGAREEVRREEEFKKGKWLREQEVSKDDEMDLFSKLDVSKINE